MANLAFPNPDDLSKPDLEEGQVFAPRFGADGLITAIATDADSGAILMVAHMNAEALAETLSTGQVTYFSRSRQQLWRKGETSGATQRLVEMKTDCDQDVVVMRVEQKSGAVCHTGRPSCFYRAVKLVNGVAYLEARDA